MVSDPIWTYLDWLILHDAKKWEFPVAFRNLVCFFVCPTTRIPQKWQGSLNKQELSTLEKPWELGFSPTFLGTKPIWTINKKQHPLPLTDDMLRASPFTAACTAHMNVLFRLTQLQMCNSFFFQSGKRPQHGCPESPWNWMWHPKLGITKWDKSKLDIWISQNSRSVLPAITQMTLSDIPASFTQWINPSYMGWFRTPLTKLNLCIYLYL